MRRITFFAIMAFFMLALPSEPARAACSSPAEETGALIFDTSTKVMKYCDGTIWLELGTGPQSGGGCTSPTGTASQLGTVGGVASYCNGYEWVTMPVSAALGIGEVRVTGGLRHTCALKPDNTLWCWGNNGDGQLGNYDGTTNLPSTVNTESTIPDTWKLVTSHFLHTCAISADNTAWCWGYGGDGQIGNDNGSNEYEPQPVEGGATWKLLSAGSWHTCGIKSDDTLWCWGRNDTGQLGTNTLDNYYRPIAVSTAGSIPDTWKAVSANNDFSCAIAMDNTLWCWGYNGDGQIGDVAEESEYLEPTAVYTADGVPDTWKAVTTGVYHTCGIGSDDTLWCWGALDRGQLGNGDNSGATLPQAVLTTGAIPDTWKEVGGGDHHTCAVGSDDTLWCWGQDNIGELGQGEIIGSLFEPTAVIISGAIPNTWSGLAVGSYHSCAVGMDNTLWCWGSGDYGNIGNGTNTEENLVPTAVIGFPYKELTAGHAHACKTDPISGQILCWGANDDYQLGDGTTDTRTTPSSGAKATEWKSLASGYMHTCAIALDDTAWCWGENISGGLGDGTYLDRLSPIPVETSGAIPDTWKEISAGGKQTCAIAMDDTAWCWGWNEFRQLGTGTGGDKVIPTKINEDGSASGIPDTWKSIKVGSTFVCGINMADDTAWCWGNNMAGYLGDGTVWQKDLPYSFDTSGSIPDTWKSISPGSYGACAVGVDDTLWCWGANWFGQIGDGTDSDRYSPTAVDTSGAIPDTWKAVAPQGSQACAIAMDDTLWCWGQNAYGQLGDGTTIDRWTPTEVDTSGAIPDTWKSVIEGESASTCAIAMDDTIWCWGENGSGQLGDGTTTSRSVPTQVLTDSIIPDTWKKAAIGNYPHICAIGADDTLWCWGHNGFGQFGNGTTGAPVVSPVPALPRIDKRPWSVLNAGNSHTCGITFSGLTSCWGLNTSGQLGDGTTTGNRSNLNIISAFPGWDMASADSVWDSCAIDKNGKLWCWGQVFNAESPMEVDTSGAIPDSWKEIKMGAATDHTCAIAVDDTLWCWGRNDEGGLGDGTTTTQYTTPTAVDTSGTIPDTWKTATAGDQGHTCAIAADDTLWCWGGGDYGQIGNSAYADSYTPAAVDVANVGNPPDTWKSVEGGALFSCAIGIDDTLWCWGYNSAGALGIGSYVNRFSPRAVVITGSIPDTWKMVGAGGQNACAIGADDTLWCWGQNFYGEGGNGTTTQTNTPVAVDVSGGIPDTWKTVGSFVDHTCAIGTDDTLWCWGDNDYGSLGDGSTTDSTSPVAVDTTGSIPDTWKEVHGGGWAGTAHTCAVAMDDTLWCWGKNAYGQLGNGTTSDAYSPTLVPMADTPRQLATISAGASTTCGVDTTGAAWCWGYNGDGQVGDATTTDRTSPTLISIAGSIPDTWVTIDTGDEHSCAIATDETAWCWGGNALGQVGDATTTQRTSPTAVTGGATWRTLAVGDSHNCGIKTDDTAWCWGRNTDGQLGKGTTSNPNSSPAAVLDTGAIPDTWKAISAGDHHTCAIAADDDSAWCWGDNDSGEIGDGTTGTDRTSPTAVSGGGEWITITAGDDFTCAMKADESTWCWGLGASGQRGDSSTTATQSTPVLSGTVPGGADGQILDAGHQHACRIKEDGTLWCWGDNGSGQLGNDDEGADQYTATAIYTFGAIPDAWKSVSTGGQNTCATALDDTLWCWGSAARGQIGNGTTTPGGGYYHAVKVADIGAIPDTWKMVKAGETPCAIGMDDTLWCWGYNNYGQLGNGTTTNTPFPTAVSNTGVIPDTWKLVTGGNNSTTCAIAMDDTLWCWGRNLIGTIGDGTTTDRLVPTATSTAGSIPDTWKAVSTGGNVTCAIAMDNTAWCWGQSTNGQLGMGGTTSTLVPAAVTVSGSIPDTWKTISLEGGQHTCAIGTDDTLWCWGYGQGWSLGNGSQTDQNVPVAVLTTGDLPDTWKSVSVGGNQFTCAVAMDDTVWCWGANFEGMTGAGDQETSYVTQPSRTWCGQDTGSPPEGFSFDENRLSLMYCDSSGSWVSLGK